MLLSLSLKEEVSSVTKVSSVVIPKGSEYKGTCVFIDGIVETFKGGTGLSFKVINPSQKDLKKIKMLSQNYGKDATVQYLCIGEGMQDLVNMPVDKAKSFIKLDTVSIVDGKFVATFTISNVSLNPVEFDYGMSSESWVGGNHVETKEGFYVEY